MKPILLLVWALFTGLCAFLQYKYCCNASIDQGDVAQTTLYTKNFELNGANGWNTTCETGEFLASSNQLIAESDDLTACLSSIADYQASNPEQTWSIIGNYAEFEANQTIFNNLGEARAQQIKQQLVETFGFDGALIEVKGNLVDSTAFNADTLLYGYLIKRGPSTEANSSESASKEEIEDPSAVSESEPYEAQFDSSQPILLRFATNSSTPQLNNSIRTQFSGLLSDLDHFQELKVKVTGHTDTNGDANANLTLGMDRAQSIKDYLIENGLAANRIEIDSKGETQPIGQDDAQNRRVEVTVE